MGPVFIGNLQFASATQVRHSYRITCTWMLVHFSELG
jgi:hypothetical protein